MAQPQVNVGVATGQWKRLHNECIYTVSQKKLCKLIFCQNFAKFRRIVKILGTRIAERTGFSEVYSFSTSPNVCQHTTVWHKLGEVKNEYTSEKLVLSAILMPKVFRIGRNLAKFWLKISLHSFFRHGVVHSSAVYPVKDTAVMGLYSNIPYVEVKSLAVDSLSAVVQSIS